MGTESKAAELEAQQSPTMTSTEQVPIEPVETDKKPWWHPIKEPGSAVQIVIAALLGIAVGLIVTTQVDDIPEAVPALLMIPGDLWLRALKAVG